MVTITFLSVIPEVTLVNLIFVVHGQPKRYTIAVISFVHLPSDISKTFRVGLEARSLIKSSTSTEKNLRERNVPWKANYELMQRRVGQRIDRGPLVNFTTINAAVLETGSGHVLSMMLKYW